MTTPIFVADTSPLIAFERLGQLELLQSILGKLYIPPTVREEAFGSNPLSEWIEERQLSQPLAPRIMAVSLGPGEREAIALALELKATRLLLDDLPARRLASSLGLEIIGTLGLLLWAKEQGLLPAVRPWVDTLLREGFYISERLLAEVLSTAGEA